MSSIAISHSSQSAHILDNGLLSLHCDAYDTLMTAWPLPRAWERSTDERKWHSIRPVISIPAGDIKELIQFNSRISNCDTHPVDRDGRQMLLPFDYCPWSESERETRLAWLHFYLLIPDDVRSSICRSYPNQQWEMLSFIAQYGTHALELIDSNPALSFALVTMNKEYRLSAGLFKLDSIGKIFNPGTSQLDMLAMVGFPPTKAVRNILRKLTADALSFRNLLSLRQSLHSSVITKTLGHLSRIDTYIIGVVTNPELCPIISPGLLQEMADWQEDDADVMSIHPFFLIEETLDIFKRLSPGRRRLPVFSSIRHVFNTMLKLQEELDEETLKNKLEECRKLPFPPAPYPGNSYIFPIDTFPALEKEALEQNNCAVGYGERIIKDKDIYLYSVTCPERCTLALIRKGDRWRIGEMYRADNLPASKLTYLMVRKWLRCQQVLERSIQ